MGKGDGISGRGSMRRQGPRLGRALLMGTLAFWTVPKGHGMGWKTREDSLNIEVSLLHF
jgi:hypothetical protein